MRIREKPGHDQTGDRQADGEVSRFRIPPGHGWIICARFDLECERNRRRLLHEALERGLHIDDRRSVQRFEIADLESQRRGTRDDGHPMHADGIRSVR